MAGLPGKRSQRAVLAMAALVLTGCGTTVPAGTQASRAGNEAIAPSGGLGQAPGDAVVAPGEVSQPGSTSAAGAPSAAGAVTPGAMPAAQQGPTQPAGRAIAGTSTSPAQLDTAGAPGVTAKTITVGIEILDTGGYNAAFESAGMKGATISDFRTMYNTVIKYINERGGVFGGRKLVPLYHEDQVTDPDANTTYQSICSHWTEDNKVWAGQAYPGWGDEQVVECLAKAGSLAIGQYNLTGPQKLYEEFNDYAFSPISMEAVAGARNQILAAKQQGFFAGTHALGGPHRVGVMYYSDNMLKAGFSQGYVPTLAKLGLKVTESAEIDPNNPSPGIQNAVLKFKTAGVDRVFVLGTSTGMSEFMTGAEGQGYRPRYGINSTNNPNLLAANAPPAQLNGAVGVAWLPATDFKLADWPANKARDLCLKIHADAGNVAASELDRAIQMAICSQMFFTSLILNTTKSLKPSAVRIAVESLGTTMETTADGIIDVYGPNKHWGAGAYYWTAYTPGCVCFKPQGAARPVQ